MAVNINCFKDYPFETNQKSPTYHPPTPPYPQKNIYINIAEHTRGIIIICILMAIETTK